MYELKKNLCEEIRESASELLREAYPEDQITEMVDSSVPIYTSDLMQLAADYPVLATAEPEIIAFDGTSTPVNIVAGNVYEALMVEAMDEWQRIKDEAEDCAECGTPTLEDGGVWVNEEPASYSYPGGIS